MFMVVVANLSRLVHTPRVKPLPGFGEGSSSREGAVGIGSSGWFYSPALFCTRLIIAQFHI